MKLNSLAFVIAALVFPVVACSSGEGSEGTTAQACDGHGTSHAGHCHCDDGYLFDGTTCVGPAQITALCEEHEEPDAGTVDGGEGDAAVDDHDHEVACRCPATGACPCAHGEVQTLAGKLYCVPALDE
jgi:hypothetical protein